MGTPFAAMHRVVGWPLGEAWDLLLPRTCPGCGAGQPWCPHCAATLAGRPRLVALPATALDAGVPPVHALGRYAGPARAAILAGKDHGRRDLPPLLGAALGAALLKMNRLSLLPRPLWLVPGPSRPAASRSRGGDPVTAMARAAAHSLARAGLDTGVAPCLYTGRGAVDSVGLDAAERAANLAGRVRFRRSGAPPAGRAVVLVDDVLTTGATVAAATATLRSVGLTVAAALVIAAVPPFVTVR